MPKVTAEHLEGRRRQILDAAYACFGRRGFHQTTMQDICLAAGLSPGAVYRYFVGKEEIIAACSARAREERAVVFAGAQGRTDTMDVFDELIDTFFPHAERPDCGMDIEVWAEALRNPAMRESQLRDVESILEPIHEIVAAAQARGEISRECKADDVARLLFSTWLGLVMQRSLDPTVDVRAYMEVVRTMVRGALWTVSTHGLPR